MHLSENPYQDSGVLEPLQHLRSFLAVARSGSVARAAELVFKAASAVTRSVGELEEALGTPLFERRPRGMLLNAYGEAVQQRAERIESEVSQVLDELGCSRSQRNSLASLLFSGHKLQLLISMAEQRNVTAVAARLGISQAGASMALKRFETALGAPLFQRMQQGLLPTDAAARLLVHAKLIAAELRHMQSDLAAIAGSLAGHVTVGALPLGRTLIVPAGIAAAVGRHPRLRVSTVESPYEALLAGLRSGDIDFIFGALRADRDTQGLLLEPLFEDRLGILARASHPLAVRERIPLADLLNEQWVLPRPDAPGRRLVDASFSELGLAPPLASVETGDLAILRSLLFSSNMLTAISPHQLCFELEAGKLVELPVELGQTVRQIGITTRAHAQLSPAAEAVLAAIRHQAGLLPPRPAAAPRGAFEA
ncbi:LysR family transcriptional regulator [Uliginosibacterium sp. TH139]|uniref:LysR family transcriptional regulator n=1 Tax=Uliginosibacterium sp. TH139 TaxID=2067453 RepID=UPI000C797674|nr:LysR family transcriptional regulator [Uliginosibacterium sp. TH139]PLK48745.1 LysR family transcriptional regulator [Uliginosibacterium sp. TH139]